MEKMLTRRLSSVTPEQKREKREREGERDREGIKCGEGMGERCLLWLSIKNVSPVCAVSEERQ